MPYRKVVEMKKEDAIKVMNDTIINMNIQLSKTQNIDDKTIMELISRDKERIQFVNEMIYDALKTNGYIKND